jgi:calcyphosin
LRSTAELLTVKHSIAIEVVIFTYNPYLKCPSEGVVDLKDVRGVYKVLHHPDFIAGKKTEEELLIDFLSNFKSPRSRGNFDGSLDRNDFEQYYRAISASIDDDDYFELVVRNAWHISGGVGSCANSSNRRVLVTREDGSQFVEEIKDDIGRGSSTRHGV